ncbi:MAG: zinc-binding alcohol dehydrogenase [Pseudomonadota bacterium]
MTEVIATTAYLEGPGNLVFREEKLDAPGPCQISCKTLASIISPGTELAAWRGMPPLRPGPIYPRLVGYCNAAEVVSVGRDVTQVSPGDRILSYASHRTHFLLDEDDVLLRLNDRMDSVPVASTYLFHLGYNALLRTSARAGSRVLVIGLGALGLTSVAMADVAGADVRAVSDHPGAAAIAREYGARSVHNRADIEAIRAGWDGRGADIVIATTGSWTDWRTAIEVAAPLGTIAVLGFPGRGEEPPSFNPLDSQFFYDKQLRIEAVGMSPEKRDGQGFLRFNQRDNIRYLSGLISSGRLQPSAIISGHFEGLRLADAYEALASRRSSPITFALDWQ